MNRIAIHIDAKGDIIDIASDTEVAVYLVCDAAPDDRVYQMTPDGGVYQTGPAAVRALLGDEPVGHHLDSHNLGAGYGPRKPPSRPTLTVVSEAAE